jgi:putative Ca2+/H+ antiporter (TMEM165/GDT1 family)
MTLKQMALKRTAIFAASALAVGVLNSLAMHYFGAATVGLVWAVMFLIFGIRFVYQTEVDRLERENTLKKLKDIK